MSSPTATPVPRSPDKNVGTGKPVTRQRDFDQRDGCRQLHVQHDGESHGRHHGARRLTVSATGVNKVYDGTTTATVTLTDNRVTGDVLTRQLHRAPSFATRTSARGKTVSVSGICDQRHRRRQLHVQHDGDDDGRHHGAALTVSATRRQQGVRRHDRGDGDPVPTTGVRGDVFTDSYTARVVRQTRTSAPARR